ncbi:MAG TPA: hypothetical protein ENI05_11630 [Porticoccus sp.]|nr:hypothetical protein [Porticoccus sp.]
MKQRIILALTLLLLLLIQPLPGAITKTTSIVEVDAWQALSAATLAVGNNHDISASYQTKVYLEIAYTDAQAQAGVDVLVEISYADDDWVLLRRFTTTGDTPATTTINDATANAGDPSITLTDATTGDFDVPARKWFIVDGTVANSESVKTVVNAVHTVTLAQDLIRSHADSLNVWDFVFEKVIAIPMAAAQVRVLINNTDADADIHWTTRVSKVTGI